MKLGRGCPCPFRRSGRGLRRVLRAVPPARLAGRCRSMARTLYDVKHLRRFRGLRRCERCRGNPHHRTARKTSASRPGDHLLRRRDRPPSSPGHSDAPHRAPPVPLPGAPRHGTECDKLPPSPEDRGVPRGAASMRPERDARERHGAASFGAHVDIHASMGPGRDARDRPERRSPRSAGRSTSAACALAATDHTDRPSNHLERRPDVRIPRTPCGARLRVRCCRTVHHRSGWATAASHPADRPPRRGSRERGARYARRQITTARRSIG